MTPQVPARDESGLHAIAPGLTMEWVHNGNIAIFTWKSVTRETIDTFTDAYKVIVDKWPKDQPYCQLNDLSFEGFAFTPYLRSKVTEVINYAMSIGIKGRVANLMKPGIAMRIVQFFLHINTLTPGMHAELFGDYNRAMAWLDRARK